MKLPRLQPTLKRILHVFNPELHVTDWTPLEKLSLIPEAVWQQPVQTSPEDHKLNNKYNDFVIKTNQTTQELENKHEAEVVSRTSPPKGSQHRHSVTDMEQFLESQTENKPVPFLNRSHICPTDILHNDYS